MTVGLTNVVFTSTSIYTYMRHMFNAFVLGLPMSNYFSTMENFSFVKFSFSDDKT